MATTKTRKKTTARKKPASAKAKPKKSAKPARSDAGSSNGVLLVVESPTKARTLTGYLPKGYKVLASKGHVRDLPRKELGVDVEHGFKPKYVQVPGRSSDIKKIRDSAKGASLVLLGPDPDREGEAIAFHIAYEINRVAKEVPIKRVLFYQITKSEVLQAIENPVEIDEQKVEAQQARRILDRIVGYKLSPLLWKVVRWGLSAGRVQTVALRLIVERERERRAFPVEPYWELAADFDEAGATFTAKLKERVWHEASAKVAHKVCSGAAFAVKDVARKKRSTSPGPPFKTSTLQSEAAGALGFGPGVTMRIAQQLYEGVNTPSGRRGLITYMRTDSVRMAGSFIGQARKLIPQLFGEKYLSQKARQYADRAKGVQGAHEAIRPTDPSLTPEQADGFLSPDQAKLYRLIWGRAVATQASEAITEVVTARLVPEGTSAPFIAEGKRLLFDGWLKVRGRRQKDVTIPPLKGGELLSPLAVRLVPKKTEPPERYTQASLIKTLEANGIGRPSTYAATVSTLFNRSYVQPTRIGIKPTPMGEVVCDVLVQNFPGLFEVEFTAKMEELLDSVEGGKESWEELLREYYQKLAPDIERFEANADEIKKGLPDVPLYYKKKSFGRRRWKGKRRSGKK